MINNKKRISIIGGSGTGKTTLANKLGETLNLPVIHLDGINYYDNWVERPKDERDKIILEKIQQDKWVIDGTYRSTLKQRLDRSDLIIYLDYSTWTQVKGVIFRRMKHIGKGNQERVEIKGCKEKLSIKFLVWVIQWRKTKRASILQTLNEYEHKSVLIFKNRRELNKWFESL